MRKIIIMILSGLLMLPAAEFSIQEGLSELNNDLTAQRYPHKDINGQWCAVLKVFTDIKDLQFEGKGYEKHIFRDGVYQVYLQKGTKDIKFRKSGFEDMRYDFPFSVEQNRVYRIVVKADQEIIRIEEVEVSFETDPTEAEITVDGSAKVENDRIVLSVGEHEIKIAKKHHQTKITKIEVDPKNTLFKFNLEPEATSLFEINSTPEGAEVFFDGVSQGETPFFSYVPAGDIKLRIEMHGYLPFEEIYNVKAPDSSKNIKLEPVPEGYVEQKTDDRFVLVESDGTVKGDFYIGKYEVTQSQFEEIMEYNPSSFHDPDKPVESLTWYEAALFCNRLSEKEGLNPCYGFWKDDFIFDPEMNGYRLADSTEWAFAAKGGKKSRKFIHSGSDDLSQVAVFYDVGYGKKDPGPEKVGTKKANELGIYDMSGNVSEFVEGYGNLTGTNYTAGVYITSRIADGKYKLGQVENNPKLQKGQNIGFRIARSATAADSPSKKIKEFIEDRKITEGYWKKEIENIKEKFVFVEGGKFDMGSDNYGEDHKPVHTVRLDDYYICKYEVTLGFYNRIMNKSGYISSENWYKPVNSVSWSDAVRFCKTLSEMFGTEQCYEYQQYTYNNEIKIHDIEYYHKKNGFRLPTEAEWEYAARSRKNIPVPDNEEEYLYNYEEYEKYSKLSKESHPVGTLFPANELGIYDINSNIWEWCWDLYDKDYYKDSKSSNPLGPKEGDGYHVLRGGWNYNDDDPRSKVYQRMKGNAYNSRTGFRIVINDISKIHTPVTGSNNLKEFKEVLVEGGEIEYDIKRIKGEGRIEKIAETVPDLYFSAYEVTRHQYVKTTGRYYNYLPEDDIPMVINLSDAIMFCNMLSEKKGLKKCYTVSGDNTICDMNANGYRLPTESEWLYTAKGGKNNRSYKYSGSNNIDKVAWYKENSKELMPVGLKEPNDLGIYDMTGNVDELCWSYYERDYVGFNRVVKGGSFVSEGKWCEITHRYSFYEKLNKNVGFRVVRKAK